jgi:Rrf2 family protein
LLRLSKRAEYAILTLDHLANRASGAPATVSAMAKRYSLPKPLLAKVCQTLKNSGMVSSVKGAAGGYLLDQPLASITVAHVLECFDVDVALVECVESDDGCQTAAHCEIKAPMAALSDAILSYLRSVSLETLLSRSPEFPENLSIFRV